MLVIRPRTTVELNERLGLLLSIFFLRQNVHNIIEMRKYITAEQQEHKSTHVDYTQYTVHTINRELDHTAY